MPTHEETDQFWRDWATLTPDERQQFREMVMKLAEDLENLPPGQFRPGLRVKSMKGADGIFEVTWAIRNGRATFEVGDPIAVGEPHIIWRRCGGHEIFGNP